MSALNGDKSRFQINRKRKMLRRQRIQALLSGLRGAAAAPDGAPSRGPRKTRTAVQ